MAILVWKVTCLQRHCSPSNIENLRSLSSLFQNLGHQFSNLNMYQNHLKNLLKQRLLGLFPRVPDLVGLGYNPGICIANKFPVDDSVGLGTTLFEPLGQNIAIPKQPEFPLFLPGYYSRPSQLFYSKGTSQEDTCTSMFHHPKFPIQNWKDKHHQKEVCYHCFITN